MFLFSFPLFGEKGECKQEFRHTKKNTQPQAEKTRAGNFWEEEGHLCADACVHRYLARRRETALFMRLPFMHVYVSVRVRVCLCMCLLCRLLHMRIGGQRGYLSVGHWTLSGLMATSSPL